MPHTVKKYSNELEKKIADLYVKGQSAKVLAETYGFKTTKSITDKAKKYYGNNAIEMHQNNVNKNYYYKTIDLSYIDDEFKAYFVGLMITDGCVHDEGTIEFDSTDKDCVAFLSKVLNKDYYEYKRQGNRANLYRIIFKNNNLIKQLERYGIKPRKSLYIKGFIPLKSENKFLPYVFRGLMDGDGWVREDGKEFYICTASKVFSEWLYDIMTNNLFMTDLNLIKGANNIYYIRTSLIKNINILRDIVYDKPFGMQRKYQRIHSEPSETIIGHLNN